MERTYIKEMRQLLETSYNYLKDGTSNGCYHLPLEDELFLVVSYDDEDNKVAAKIAYNASWAEGKYNWCLPIFKESYRGCYVQVSLNNCRGFRKIAEFLYGQAKFMIKNRNQGLLIDWRKNK